MQIVFFGTSSFAARVLAHLLEHHVAIAAVVTRPDRPSGRHRSLAAPPVKEACVKICPQIPIHQPEKASTPEFETLLRSYNADLFVVVAYGEILKKSLLEIPKLGCLNIHASLLPKYRGAAPIQRALMEGEKKTGITLIAMTPQMDAGDILAVAPLPVSEAMTFGELEPLLCQLACELVSIVIAQFQEGKVTRVPQEHALATLAPKLTPQEEKIDWKKPASAIHNQIRALSPTPGAWCDIRIGSEPRRLKVKRSLPLQEEHGTPGHILHLGREGWVVACGEGALRLLEVQLEGKKTMPAEEFLKGVHPPIAML